MTTKTNYLLFDKLISGEFGDPSWNTFMSNFTLLDKLLKFFIGSKIIGSYYTYPFTTGAAMGTLALVANRFYFFPYFSAGETVDRIATSVQTLADPSKIRMAIYADNGDYYPGSLIVQSDELDGSTTGVKETTINQVLAPGLYWLSIVSGHTPTVRAFLSAEHTRVVALDSTLTSSTQNTCMQYSGVYGAYPATFGGAAPGTLTGTMPLVALRKSA